MTEQLEPLTVAVVSRNEGHLLQPCLELASSWADHLVVFDMASSDDTAQRARVAGAELVPVGVANVVEKVRQQIMDACGTDWVVLLDPDEHVSPDMGRECRRAIDLHQSAAAFRWPFADRFFGQPLTHSRPQARKIVLVNRHRADFSGCDRAHAEPECSGDIVDLSVDQATPIEHHTFRGVEQIAEKLTRYAATGNPLRHQGLEGSDFLLARLLLRHVVRQRAWRDGRAGVDAASLSALHDYLACLRQWEERGARPATVRPRSRIALEVLDRALVSADQLRRRLRHR